MARYLITRFLFVLFANFFYNWSLNSKYILTNFFGKEFSVFWNCILFFSILLVGAFVICIIFSTIHLLEDFSLKGTINKLKQKGLNNIVIIYIKKFWTKLNDNYFIEKEKELYPYHLIVGFAILLYFIKGNPFINNYYGIYKETERTVSRRDGVHTVYDEEPFYIIPIKVFKEMKREYPTHTPYNVKINKRGYIFIKAGFIDGYTSTDNKQKGFISYFGCLMYYAVEKSILTFIYFFIPFVISIIYTKYYNKRKSKSIKL